MAKLPRLPNKRARPPKGWKDVFLKVLATNGIVSGACEKAQVSRRSAYQHRDDDPEFKRAWDEALEASCDLMEAEAVRRGVKGVEKPVYQGGKRVGTVREYSDTLLIFMLKANRPAKFREPKAGVTFKVGSMPAPHRIDDDDPRFVAGHEPPAVECDPDEDAPA